MRYPGVSTKRRRFLGSRVVIKSATTIPYRITQTNADYFDFGAGIQPPQLHHFGTKGPVLTILRTVIAILNRECTGNGLRSFLQVLQGPCQLPLFLAVTICFTCDGAAISQAFNSSFSISPTLTFRTSASASGVMRLSLLIRSRIDASSWLILPSANDIC